MRRTRAGAFTLLGLLSIVLVLVGVGCQRSEQLPAGVFDGGTDADCLPNANFVDQHGNPVNLASLRGKWVLIDFIYTRCPGPCELMTSKLAKVADRLSATLGKKVEFVSITLDPEHDGPRQLRAWAAAQGAQKPGWLFLTGSVQNLDKAMAPFKVQRHVEPDGSIDHVIEYFLVSPNGHERRQYSPNEATSQVVANDLRTLAS
jgi:protein SCO1/2